MSMKRADIGERKSQCWVSQWRPAGRDAYGRPTHYLWLTQEEMMQAATTGHVDIPESHIPDAVLAQRDLDREMEAVGV